MYRNTRITDLLKLLQEKVDSKDDVNESSQDLVDILATHEGWAVAEQFKKILDNPTSEGIEDAELNPNAVRIIYRFLNKRAGDVTADEVAEAIEKWVEKGWGPEDVIESKVDEDVKEVPQTMKPQTEPNVETPDDMEDIEKEDLNKLDVSKKKDRTDVMKEVPDKDLVIEPQDGVNEGSKDVVAVYVQQISSNRFDVCLQDAAGGKDDSVQQFDDLKDAQDKGKAIAKVLNTSYQGTHYLGKKESKNSSLYLCSECCKTFESKIAACIFCKSKEVELLLLVEGYKERGRRDGTGPHRDSAQRSRSDRGRRKEAGEECPVEKELEEDYRQISPGQYIVTFLDGEVKELEADSRVDAMAKAREHSPEKRVMKAELIKQSSPTRRVEAKEMKPMTTVEIVRSALDPDSYNIRIVELPEGTMTTAGTGSDKEGILKQGKELAKSLNAKFLGIIDEKKIKEQEEVDNFKTVAKGVIDKETADKLAKEKNGIVVDSDDEKEKFEVIVKENEEGEENFDVQNLQEIAAESMNNTALDSPLEINDLIFLLVKLKKKLEVEQEGEDGYLRRQREQEEGMADYS